MFRRLALIRFPFPIIQTYEEYMNHLMATHPQYAGFAAGMFPPGVRHRCVLRSPRDFESDLRFQGYPMGYDPSGFYPMMYDHRGMPIPMPGTGYETGMDMYLPPGNASHSSRSRNPTEVNRRCSFALIRLVRLV